MRLWQPFFSPNTEGTRGRRERHLHVVLCVMYFMRLFSESTFTMCFQQLLRDFSLSTALATCRMLLLILVPLKGEGGSGWGVTSNGLPAAISWRRTDSPSQQLATRTSAFIHTHALTHIKPPHALHTHTYMLTLLIITCVPWREHFDMNSNCSTCPLCTVAAAGCRGRLSRCRADWIAGWSFKLRAIGCYLCGLHF